MRIERIVISGDIFRTYDGEPNQLSNVRWLRGEVSRVLYELTGLWPDVGFRRNAADGGRALIAGCYRLLGHTPSIHAWAATFGETAPPGALIEELRPDYERALVVGFELSPLMRSVLDGIGAPWVDVGVGRIRFLDDLALSFRFSWPAAPVHPGLVSRHHLQEAVAHLRARHRDDAAAADLAGACVFLAQTQNDRTLIKDGAFFPDGEAVERVAQALDGRPLVLKPHPLAPNNPILAALERRFAARMTAAGIYAILAAARDVRFVTISSSAAIEAREFGHEALMFHPAAHADPGAILSLWAHRCASFWRATLAPVLRLKPEIECEEPPTPDRLRCMLGAWGMPQLRVHERLTALPT
jgi:hypothetical protein